MPDKIINLDLYRDRTVQDWHRDNLPTECWAIDLDLMGACNVCRDPLYLIESSTNPNKPTTILRRLAALANLPAFLVFHRDGAVTGGQLLTHSQHGYDAVELLGVFRQIRLWHAGVAHPQRTPVFDQEATS